MSQISEITCVCCPFGCRMQIQHEASQIQSVSGNRCPRGSKYAAQELVDPRRGLTTTIPIQNGTIAQLPVKTSAPVPKKRLREIASEIQKLSVKAPVQCGDVLLDAVDGDQDIKLIATRSIPQRV